MMFAWVAPEWRRQGVLNRRWAVWTTEYGYFVLGPPISDEMTVLCASQKHPTEPVLI